MDKKVETTERISKTLTVADKIWEDIKDVKLEMFALPNQFVNSYCEQIKIEPSKLYLTSKVSAVLPILEEALRGRYNVEKINKYIVVSIPSDL
jgi:hypothetical protein